MSVVERVGHVYSDIDGTFVENSSSEVSLENQRAIQELQANDTQITLTTGRYGEASLPVARAVGLSGIIICDNGATIRDIESGSILYQMWLEPAVVAEATRVVLEHECDLLGNQPEYNLLHPDNHDNLNPRNAAPCVYGNIPSPRVPAAVDRLNKIGGLVVFTTENFVSPGTTSLQITDTKATKFHGIQAAQAWIEPVGRSLGIGDGRNDLDLHAAVDVRVAMSNAHPDLIAQADYVVGTVKEHGFAQAAYQFVLGRPYPDTIAA